MPIAGALQRGWARYGALLEHYPIRTKAVTACVIFTTADITRQAIEHRNTNQNQHASGSAGSDSGEPSSPRPAQPDIDAHRLPLPQWYDGARTLRLAGFYSLVHAPWIHVWFGLLERMVGSGGGARRVVAKVAIDQLLNMPAFMGLMLFTAPLLAGHDVDYAARKLRRDWGETVQTALCVWVPANLVNFSLVPLKYRLLFANIVQVGFGVFISKMANR